VAGGASQEAKSNICAAEQRFDHEALHPSQRDVTRQIQEPQAEIAVDDRFGRYFHKAEDAANGGW